MNRAEGLRTSSQRLRARHPLHTTCTHTLIFSRGTISLRRRSRGERSALDCIRRSARLSIQEQLRAMLALLSSGYMSGVSSAIHRTLETRANNHWTEAQAARTPLWFSRRSSNQRAARARASRSTNAGARTARRCTLPPSHLRFNSASLSFFQMQQAVIR